MKKQAVLQRIWLQEGLFLLFRYEKNIHYGISSISVFDMLCIRMDQVQDEQLFFLGQ